MSHDILIPVATHESDGLDHARGAANVARKLLGDDDALVFVAIVGAPYRMSAQHPPDADTLANEAALAKVREELDQLAEPYRSVGVQAKTMVVTADDAGQGVLDAAKEAHVGMIVMGAAHRTSLGRVVLGSVTQMVTQKAEVPTLVLHHPQGDPKHPAAITQPPIP